MTRAAARWTTVALLLFLVAACGDGTEHRGGDATPDAAPAGTIPAFDLADAGHLPDGWVQSSTGGGATDWQVVEEDGRAALAQLRGENPNGHFNLAVRLGEELRDADLAVEWKARAGTFDRGGGLVWRYRDPANYYVVRANPLEDNVVLYKVEDGVRTDLPLVGEGRTYGTQVEPMGTAWHRLRVLVLGSRFTVFLDGRRLFEVEDETFGEAGKIGLWTKADAVTAFRDLTVAPAR